MNKPQGMTSHDAVGFIRRLTGVRRVGHTGTLDPMAEGVLPLCIGGATRVIEFIETGAGAGRVSPDMKAYDCEMRLGVETDTLDVWGGVTAETDGAGVRAAVTPERVREAFASMTGDVPQIPPAYSAIKYKGKKLYEYARRGEAIPPEALSPREVHIEKIDVTTIAFDDDDADNTLKGFATIGFSVVCSSGTYVRSIVRDAGAALGCGAAMSALTRTKSGLFTLADAHSKEELERAAEDGRLSALCLPVDAAIAFMPIAELDEKEGARFANGAKARAGQQGDGPLLSCPSAAAPRSVRVYCKGRFLGIGGFADGAISPRKVIAT
jgi:tRNA pseudouridine55 synthase